MPFSLVHKKNIIYLRTYHQVMKSVTALRKEFDLPENQPIIPFSSITGEGVRNVWRVFRDVLSGESSLLMEVCISIHIYKCV
jgi:hypothetical protein